MNLPPKSLVLSVLLIVYNGNARADQVVNIFDLTEDVPTATIDGIPVTPLPDSTADYLHFQYTPESAWQWADHISIYQWSKDLLEPGTTEVSDRLLVTYDYPTMGNIIDVQFDSRDTILIPQGNFNGAIFRAREETGSLQLMFGIYGGDSGEFFYAASDLDVPEPSAIALFGMGALGIIGSGWRKRS